ncbi:unnamed protein product [Spirodela intermedia]|uniref:Uncharacterized protein n=1 Tax=Spirodela intermedia TaxID=51605 RepID=A0A7I8K721_SPIIN|nr:unnamed protein product [Spirodela intermedia]
MEGLPPLVLASQEQGEVEEDSEEEPPCDGDPEAVPLAEIGDPLLEEDVRPSSDTGFAGDVHHENPAHGSEHPLLHRCRNLAERRVHRLVGVLHHGEIVEPDPVGRHPLPGYEEAAEEEVVGENRHHNGEAHHHVGDDPGEEGDEGVPGPEGGQDDEEDDEEGYGDEGVGEHVGRPAIGVVGRLPHEDEAFLEEDWKSVCAGEAQPLLDALRGRVEPPENGGEDDPRHHDGAHAQREELRHAAGKGFTNVGTAAAPPAPPPETSLPREMLALMASSREQPGADGLTLCGFFPACRARLNSTSGLAAPPGADSSRLRITSRANSQRFSLSGMGRPNSAKKEGSPPGEPLHDHDASPLRDALEHLHHHESGGGVEPRGGLIEEEEDGVVNDVDADGDPPSLTAGDAAVALVADDGLGGAAQAQLPELGGEHERLLHGEHGKEEIVLHDVGGDDLEQAALQELARIDQRRLAGAAGPEDGEDLPFLGLAGDGVEESLGGGELVLVPPLQEGQLLGDLDAVGELREGEHERWRLFRRRRVSDELKNVTVRGRIHVPRLFSSILFSGLLHAPEELPQRRRLRELPLTHGDAVFLTHGGGRGRGRGGVLVVGQLLQVPRHQHPAALLYISTEEDVSVTVKEKDT